MSVDVTPSRAHRCSAVTRLMNSSPAATAGSYDSVLLIDRPLPWPRDVADDAGLAAVTGMAHSGRAVTGRTRVQALVPDGPLGVTLYRRSIAPEGTFERVDAEAEGAQMDRARALLEGKGAAPSSTVGRESSPVTILVCTHGRRDACCGSLGPRVYAGLVEMYAGSSRCEVRRTSHLGGHRFAPTVALLPSGTLWAWVDSELMHGIVEETAPVESALPHFRGAMGLDDPEVQALDGVLLAEHGWSWLRCARQGSVMQREGASAQVELAHEDGGRRWVTTATVTRVGTTPVPVCGRALDGSEKSQPQFAVTAVGTVPG